MTSTELSGIKNDDWILLNYRESVIYKWTRNASFRERKITVFQSLVMKHAIYCNRILIY